MSLISKEYNHHKIRFLDELCQGGPGEYVKKESFTSFSSFISLQSKIICNVELSHEEFLCLQSTVLAAAFKDRRIHNTNYATHVLIENYQGNVHFSAP